ncbi:MAG: tetratricopeptide repeat protein, partial [Rhodospirillales bacterium]|nr:tetratricopeptide repeat protein [Rhodospirillales bacterium]
MMDSRCVPISYDDPAVLARYDATLTELHRFADDPVAAIEDILIEHPDFALGHIFRAVCFAGGSTARYIPAMEHSLSHAEAIGTPLNERERGLVAAVRKRCTGDWRGAQQAVEAILAAFPRDSLALHFGHQLDFLLGDSLNLRGRVERVFPY